MDTTEQLFRLYEVYLGQAPLYRKMTMGSEEPQCIQYFTDSSNEAMDFARVALGIFQGSPLVPAPLPLAHWVRVRAANDALNAMVANGGSLQFDTVDIDSDGYAPTSSPFDHITIPVGRDGVYTVMATSSSSGTQASTIGMGLVVNGAITLSGTNKSIGGGGSLSYTLDNDAVQILKFKAGNTIGLKNNSVSGGTDSFKSTYLTLAWLGV
jgi:hypothetical protein